MLVSKRRENRQASCGKKAGIGRVSRGVGGTTAGHTHRLKKTNPPSHPHSSTGTSCFTQPSVLLSSSCSPGSAVEMGFGLRVPRSVPFKSTTCIAFCYIPPPQALLRSCSGKWAPWRRTSRCHSTAWGWAQTSRQSWR